MTNSKKVSNSCLFFAFKYKISLLLLAKIKIIIYRLKVLFYKNLTLF